MKTKLSFPHPHKKLITKTTNINHTFSQNILNTPNASNISVYKRNKPSIGISFNTKKSNELLTQCLTSGYYHSFYSLISQFHTQTHPSYCGISCLVMILNSLSIDPHKKWKGIWRWYSEDTVNCVNLTMIERHGMNMEEFNIVSKCNNLYTSVFRPDEDEDKTKLYLHDIILSYKKNQLNKSNTNNENKHLKDCNSLHYKYSSHNKSTSIRHDPANKHCKNQDINSYRLANYDMFETACIMSSRREGIITACSYYRKALNQTGDGHFSAVALYNPFSKDVLMLDVARFKYQSLWIPVRKVYDSFKSKDKTTELSRGFLLCGRYFYMNPGICRVVLVDELSNLRCVYEEVLRIVSSDKKKLCFETFFLLLLKSNEDKDDHIGNSKINQCIVDFKVSIMLYIYDLDNRTSDLPSNYIKEDQIKYKNENISFTKESLFEEIKTFIYENQINIREIIYNLVELDSKERGAFSILLLLFYLERCNYEDIFSLIYISLFYYKEVLDLESDCVLRNEVLKMRIIFGL